MTRIALVTTREARALDDDLPPLLDALHACGAEAEPVDWHDAAADWARYDLALLRSTWDYTQRLPEFLAWAARAATLTRLPGSMTARSAARATSSRGKRARSSAIGWHLSERPRKL